MDEELQFDFERSLHSVGTAKPLLRSNRKDAVPRIPELPSASVGQQPGNYKKNYRQTVCTYWLKGLCMKGDNCGFLHQLDPQRMPVCRAVLKYGVCKEPDCLFKHSLDDVKECNMFKLGFCIYGNNCRYKHTKLPGPPPDPEMLEAAKPREYRNINIVVNEVNPNIAAGEQRPHKRQRKFAAEDKGRVFLTDWIMTAIMCATRSVYSWDVVITKVGDKLFFDKRDQSPICYLTTNETAPDQVPEDKDNINGTQKLSIEATVANQNFSQQILTKGMSCKFPNPNPFGTSDDTELASRGYKYRKWSMSDGSLDIIVRCEIDAVQDAGGRPLMVSTKGLVEFCQKQGAHLDWRQKLESQRGAVFATELKNNGNKIAKWTTAALLANVDLIKLGYVSRTSPKDNQRHALLGMQVYKPKEFAQQIGLKMDLCWAILMKLVTLCMNREDGKYLLVKDPNQTSLSLYEIPGDTL